MFIVKIGISLTTCFGRSGPSSSNTYVDLYQEEILHYKLFGVKWDLIFTIYKFH